LIYGILMLHEKIKGERLADSYLREESAEAAGRPNLPPDVIEAITGPFGNSTKQNRVSGLTGTSALARPTDRLP
jgi:hypothetical protein